MSLKMCYLNLFDDNTLGTLTVSSAVASLPATNLQHFWKTKVWRATGDVAEWIKMRFTNAQAIKVAIIIGHNFSSAGAYKIQGSNDNFATTPIDQALTHHADIMLHVWKTAQSYKDWRFTIADGTNPDTYVEAGRAFLGSHLETEYWCPKGWQVVEIDPTEIDESSDGVESLNEKTPYKIFTLPFKTLLPANVITVWEAVRKKDPLFIICDYANELVTDGRHDLSRYVKFYQEPVFTGAYLLRKDFTLIFKEQR